MPAESGDWELARRCETLEEAKAYAYHLADFAPNYQVKIHACGSGYAVEWRKVTYG